MQVANVVHSSDNRRFIGGLVVVELGAWSQICSSSFLRRRTVDGT